MSAIRNRKRSTPRQQWFIHGFFPAVLLGQASEFVDLGAYQDHVGEFLSGEAARFEKGVRARANSMDLKDEDRDAFFESHEQDFDRWHSSFPATLRSTVLIASCSRLETGLTHLCKDLDSEAEIPSVESWPKNKASPREKAKRYLSANFGLEFASHPLWPRIQALYKVRDCFTHAGGDVSLMKEPTELPRAVALLQASGVTGVEIDDYDRIQIDDSFLRDVIRTMTVFWEDLEAALVENAVVGPALWP